MSSVLLDRSLLVEAEGEDAGPEVKEVGDGPGVILKWTSCCQDGMRCDVLRPFVVQGGYCRRLLSVNGDWLDGDPEQERMMATCAVSKKRQEGKGPMCFSASLDGREMVGRIG